MNKSTSNPLFSSPGGLKRRAFLATAALASTITLIPRRVLGGPGQSPPSEKVNVAGIGVGGMGGANPQDADMQWPAEGGALFKGSKGLLLCGVSGNAPKLLPLSRHLEYQRPAQTLPRIPEHCHEMDWVRAIKNGRQTEAGFAYSSPLTETCLLGNVAKRVDGPIEWDAANLKVKNSEAATRLIRTQYRAGWSL